MRSCWLGRLAIPLLLIALLAACGGGTPPVALNATPTRTPRPTFTPLPADTDTPGAPTATPAASTATPAAAATAIATAAPATAAATDTASAPPTAAVPTRTAAPRPTLPPALPTQPPPPPPPTQVVLPIQPDRDPAVHSCDQEGSFDEIVIDVRHRGDSPRKFAAGLTYALLDPGGRLLTDGAGKPLVGVTDDGGQSGYAYGSDCLRDSSILSPIRFNGKLDVGDVVRRGTVQAIFRFVQSANNMTPLSPDVPLDFPTKGARRWWLRFGAP